MGLTNATKKGAFPKDWEITPLNSIAFVTSGKRLPLGKSLTKVETPHPYIRVSDMRVGGIDVQELMYVPVDVFPSIKKYRIFIDDIFISVAGTLGIVGKIPKELDGANLTENADRITDISCSRDYLLYVLISRLIQGQIESIQTIGAQPKLALKRIRDFNIPLPPTLKEQQAIAEVLSDMDAYIESLEQLIAKKRLIKQGVMQELLTGKRRLPGFTGKWEERKLDEIGEISGAGVDKKIKTDESPIRLVNYLDVYHRNLIFSKDLHHWVTAPANKVLKCAVQKGDIFFTPTSEVPYDIANSAVAMEDIQDAAYSYHLVRLRLYESNNWDLLFRAYIFATRHFLSQAETMCEGSGTRYVITLKRFRELSVFYPTDNLEQAAIAEVLSNMDIEITTLENKLDKLNKIKEGMIQELLTGRIRLV